MSTNGAKLLGILAMVVYLHPVHPLATPITVAENGVNDITTLRQIVFNSILDSVASPVHRTANVLQATFIDFHTFQATGPNYSCPGIKY